MISGANSIPDGLKPTPRPTFPPPVNSAKQAKVAGKRRVITDDDEKCKVDDNKSFAINNKW